MNSQGINFLVGKAGIREMWRFQITFSVLAAVFEAWRIMYNGQISRLRLQPVSALFSLPSDSTDEIVRWIDSVLKLLVCGSKHQCFYRSYTIARVLRKRGVPVVLNIGLRNLNSSMKTRGHCWLTLDGSEFFEHLLNPQHVSPVDLYPFIMGTIGDDIVYWVNGSDDDRLSRRKIEGFDKSLPKGM